MKRANLYRILKYLLVALTRTEYVGSEYMPKQGGAIVATNHLSQLDTPLLMLNPARSDMTALVTDKYQKFLFMRWFVTSAEGIWIDRTKADFSAFRAAIETLRRGQPVGIAPEGTRSQTGGLLQGKPGTILLALKANVPIVPVAITGTESGFRKIFTLQRPHFMARFGKPFLLPEISRDNRDEAMQMLSDEIMLQIAALLPPQYHGFYTGHPRIAEIQAEYANLPEPTRVRIRTKWLEPQSGYIALKDSRTGQ